MSRESYWQPPGAFVQCCLVDRRGGVSYVAVSLRQRLDAIPATVEFLDVRYARTTKSTVGGWPIYQEAA